MYCTQRTCQKYYKKRGMDFFVEGEEGRIPDYKYVFLVFTVSQSQSWEPGFEFQNPGFGCCVWVF